MTRFSSALAVMLSGAAFAATGAQTVGGIARNAATRAPLPGLIVMLITPDHSAIVAQDSTRAGGTFFIDAKPGKYTLAFSTDSGVVLGASFAVELFPDSTIQAVYLLRLPEPIYSAEEVDQPAKPIVKRSSGDPEMRIAEGATPEGKAVFSFVIDTLGAVEPGTIELVSTNNVKYAERAAERLATLRYTPAIKAGRPVRQRLVSASETRGELVTTKKVPFVTPESRTRGRVVPMRSP